MKTKIVYLVRVNSGYLTDIKTDTAKYSWVACQHCAIRFADRQVAHNIAHRYGSAARVVRFREKTK